MNFYKIVNKIAKELIAGFIEGKLQLNGKVSGIVEFAITRKDHVSIRTPSGKTIQFRNQDFHVAMHLYEKNGQWEISQSRGEVYISRGMGLGDAPPSFQKVIIGEMFEKWNEHIKANPELSEEADVNKHEELLETAKTDLENALKNVAEWKDIVAELEKSGADLQKIETKMYAIRKHSSRNY